MLTYALACDSANFITISRHHLCDCWQSEHGIIAGGQEQMAAGKKLLRAEVASLKRQTAEQRMSLQIIQHDVNQVRSFSNKCTSEVNAQLCVYSALVLTITADRVTQTLGLVHADCMLCCSLYASCMPAFCKAWWDCNVWGPESPWP